METFISSCLSSTLDTNKINNYLYWTTSLSCLVILHANDSLPLDQPKQVTVNQSSQHIMMKETFAFPTDLKFSKTLRIFSHRKHTYWKRNPDYIFIFLTELCLVKIEEWLEKRRIWRNFLYIWLWHSHEWASSLTVYGIKEESRTENRSQKRTEVIEPFRHTVLISNYTFNENVYNHVHAKNKKIIHDLTCLPYYECRQHCFTMIICIICIRWYTEWNLSF